MTKRSLVMALLLTGCGGALSSEALSDLRQEVDARNAARLAASDARLRAEGYRFPDGDPDLFLVSIAPSSGRCSAPPEWVAVTLLPTLSGAPRIQADMEGAALCRFLFGRADTLEATLPDGVIPLHRLDGRLARDPDGALVRVLYEVDVVERREVLVERSCDHMPSPIPDPLEHPAGIATVRGAGPPRELRVRVEREEIDVRCTDNTY